MDEISLLKTELGIYNDCCDAEVNDYGRIVSLYIYDPEYEEFYYEGNIISLLNNYSNLKKLIIDVSSYKIDDISALAEFPDLESLALIDCYTANDISTLSNLKNLESLTITNAGVTDIQPLKNLTRLKNINFTGNEITNINVLENCIQLEVIIFSNNKIASIDILKNHKKIINAFFDSNRIEDASALSASANLVTLDIRENKLTDVSFLANLSLLEYLHLEGNQIEELGFLQYLPLLKTLNCSNNSINNITPISALTNLLHLNILNLPLKDIQPLMNTTQLIHLNAGPIENFEGNIISKLTGLTQLQLKNCKINKLSFLNSLKKLFFLNLEDNNIEDFSPILDLTQLGHIILKNNQISIPFPVRRFDRLNTLDLTGNPFGNKIYSGGSYWNAGRLNELYRDTANYWLQKGDDDMALGYFYVDSSEKISLNIYYKKLLACDPADDYFRLYYVMRCENIIKNIRRNLKQPDDEEILDIRVHIVDIVKNSDFFNKTELLISLEDDGKNLLNYNFYSEYTAYLNITGVKKAHPEMLYKLGANTLNRRVDLDNLLSLYKQLIDLDSPLHVALYRKIDGILANSFAYNPPEREAYAYYRDLLLHAAERNIPFFNTVTWFKATHSHYNHNIPLPRINIPPVTKPAYHHTSTTMFTWPFAARLLLILIILIPILRSCK